MKILFSLKNNFSVDLRSLAVTRIAFSLLIFADLLIRSRYLEEFFTDSGVLPVSALKSLYPVNYRTSIHALSGEYGFEVLLFLLATIFAFLLLIGLFTRIATIISWALLVSLNLRNPLILQGGDLLFRCLMFWSIFIPWGERFSVDAFLNKNKRVNNFVFSAGAMAFIFQIMFLYFFSATLKSGKFWNEDYTAIYYALSLGHFSHLVGPYLYKFPYLMKVMTFFVYWLELLGPFILLIPYKNSFFRILFIVLFGSLQLGLVSTLRLGLFPWFSMMALLILLPSSFWDFFPRLENKLYQIFAKLSSGIKSVYKDIGNLKYYNVKWPRAINLLISTFIFVLLIYVLFWNLSHTYEEKFGFMKNLSYIGKPFQLNQKWNMFAPQPYRSDGWFVIVGQLDNGKLVDVYRDGKEINWNPPLNRIGDYPSYRWRKYLWNFNKNKYYNNRDNFGKYVCKKWNESDNKPNLMDIDMYFVSERNLPDYNVAEPKKNKIYGYDCIAGKGK
ncbi:MAG: hypothetical protein ACR2NW_04095 [Thermodesulfobacteriota bacterium]